LTLLDQVEGGSVGSLAAARAAQEVDREVRGDPVEPGVERVALVVTVQLAPDPKEDHLPDVPRVLAVADDAPRQRHDRRSLPGHQRLEGDHVAAAGADRELAIRKARSLLSVPALTVDELHCPKGLLLPLYTDAAGDPLGSEIGRAHV